MATATWHLSLRAAGERGLELRAAVQGVSAFACLNLYKLPHEIEPLRLGEVAKRLSLRFNAETRAALLRGPIP